MPLIINLRHLEKRNLHLEGELSAAELDLADLDEMVELPDGLEYGLEVERLNQSILIRGRLEATLACQCVRCLRPFTRPLELPDWTLDLPLEGEEKVLVTNDCIDLTPYLREDTLLAFPQHPLCEPGCRGLLDPEHNLHEPASVEEARTGSSVWAELNKLKLKE